MNELESPSLKKGGAPTMNQRITRLAQEVENIKLANTKEHEEFFDLFKRLIVVFGDFKEANIMHFHNINADLKEVISEIEYNRQSMETYEALKEYISLLEEEITSMKPKEALMPVQDIVNNLKRFVD